MSDPELLSTRTQLDVVPGWFYPADVELFRWFLLRQHHRGETGDLVELGAYLGKSAVVIGDYVQPGETFSVVDLFGIEPGDDANHLENLGSYPSLTRDAFEANYRRFHTDLPATYTALSSAVTDHVAPGSVRFMHVDASHLYEHVVLDVDAARTLLAADGLVVFDDYRSPHTPGVAAAVWNAVLTLGLRPICLTSMKLYGTWGETDAVIAELCTYLDARSDAGFEIQSVAGHDLVRCWFTE